MNYIILILIFLGLPILFWEVFAKEKKTTKILAMISIISFIGLGYISINGENAIKKLKKEMETTEKNLDIANEYSTVKRLTQGGWYQTGPTSGFANSTRISKLMGEILVYDEEKKEYEDYCIDEDNINKIKTITEIEPLYPFSYKMLYVCTGEEKYRSAAIQHLENIVLVEDHLPVHNKVLEDLKNSKY